MMCGTAEWEWADNPYAYEAVNHLCRGCYTKEAASEGEGRQLGVTVELRPTGTVESARRFLAAQRLASS